MKKSDNVVSDNTLVYVNDYSNLSKEEYSNDYKVFLKNCAIELMLKQFLKPKKMPQREYDLPTYFEYQYNIIDKKQLINELLANSLLRRVTLLEYLNTLKTNELKRILENNNIKNNNSKNKLIQKIIDNNIFIDDLFKNEYLIISDSGKKLYEKNIYLIDIHKNKYDIKLEEYYEMSKKLPNSKGFKYEDIVWSILNKKKLKYESNKNYLELYHTYQNIAVFLISENRNKQAIEYIIKSIIYDLIGINFSNEIDTYCFLLSDDGTSYCTQKDFLQDLKELSCHIDINNLKLLIKTKIEYNQELLIQEYNKINSKINLCSLQTISKFIELIIKFDYDYKIDDLVNIVRLEEERINSERFRNIRKYIKVIKDEIKKEV